MEWQNHIHMTHGHEQRCGDHWGSWGVLGGAGQKGENWDNCNSIINQAVNHKLPIAATFWIIHIVSTEECSRLIQNLMQIHCSICSVILNVTTTQSTRSLNDIYCPQWLVQWSCHCSHMCIPVHSPWLSGYINVAHSSHYINNGWIFSGQTMYSFIRNYPILFHLTFPSAMDKQAIFPHIIDNIWVVTIFFLRHSYSCAVISHCGFYLHFPDG